MFSKRKFDIVSYYIRLMTIVLLGAVMISFLWGCSPGRSSSEKENPQNVNLREETNSHKETKADSNDSDAKEPSFSINTKDNIGNEAAVDTKDTDNIKVINTLNGKTEAHNENYEGNNEEKVREEDKNGNNITLIMVGDILLHDAVNKCFEYEKGVYDYSPIFSNTKDEIQDADIAIVNQEVIIGGKDLGVSGYPSFNAPYEYTIRRKTVRKYMYMKKTG